MAVSKTQYETNTLYDLSIDEIQLNPHQPRKFFDVEKLASLKSSILETGILQPLLVKDVDGEVLLVAGERRYRAAKEAKLTKVRVLFTDGDAEEISLIENLQREDLNPIEESEALAQLIKNKKLKDKDLVPILGKAKSTISEIKKLNSLPDKIKDECRQSNTWSRAALLELAKIDDEKLQWKLFNKIKKKGITNDQLRAISRKGSKHNPPQAVAIKHLDNLQKFFTTFRAEKKNTITPEMKKSIQAMRDFLDQLLD